MTEQQDLDAAYEREVTNTEEAEHLQKAVFDALVAYAKYLDDHGLIWDANISELKVKRLIADIDFHGCEESAYDRTYGVTLARLRTAQGTKPAATTSTEPVADDPASLSMTAQQKLEAYKRQVRRDLEAQFEQRVRAEAIQWFDETLREWHRQLEQAKSKIREFNDMLARRKPILSRRTFRILAAGVQPDRGGTNAAAVEFNTNREAIEAVLCGNEAEERRWELPSDTLPRNRAELMAAKAAKTAENSDRAKRAAATRADRKANK